jgi:hypothetical protein
LGEVVCFESLVPKWVSKMLAFLALKDLFSDSNKLRVLAEFGSICEPVAN